MSDIRCTDPRIWRKYPRAFWSSVPPLPVSSSSVQIVIVPRGCLSSCATNEANCFKPGSKWEIDIWMLGKYTLAQLKAFKVLGH